VLKLKATIAIGNLDSTRHKCFNCYYKGTSCKERNVQTIKVEVGVGFGERGGG